MESRMARVVREVRQKGEVYGEAGLLLIHIPFHLHNQTHLHALIFYLINRTSGHTTYQTVVDALNPSGLKVRRP